MNEDSSNLELEEQVSFIQHDIPGLEDGRYLLEVSQTVKDATDKTTLDDGTLVNSYKFAVQGDRFRLAKPTEILYSVFPAADASGEYGSVFPSVVFTKTTFPWSRCPTKELVERPAPGKSTDEDQATWLTVILLDDDDIGQYASNGKGFALQTQSGNIGDLFPKSIYLASSLPATAYSYFNGAKDTVPDDYMDPGDQLTDAIQLLDIPLSLFFKIAPTLDDLKLMAHVREVSLENKATMPGISDVGEPLGRFSIVFGNRLPKPQKKTYAYLVSLEGLEDFLPTAKEGGKPGGFVLDETFSLRLAVLKSWSFYATGESATFVEQMSALNGAAMTAASDGQGVNIANKNLVSNTNLQLTPAANALPIVKNALNMGYVPLNHQLRTSEEVTKTVPAESEGNKAPSGEPTTVTVIEPEKTVSWYRGPLVPYPVTKAAVSLPISSPDKATIFDPTTGMLDTSYAAAWALGRQLALQDPSFSTALYNWKKQLTADIIYLIDNGVMAANFGLGGDDAPADAKVEAPIAEARYLNGRPKKLLRPRPKRGSFMRNAILSLKKV